MPVPYITMEGRVVADPELKYSQGGMAHCKMRVVASSRKKNEQDEWVDDKTFWVSVTAFRKLAENVAESIVKGDVVVITGRLMTDEWTTEAGEKRTAPSILADNVSASLLFRTVKAVQTTRSTGGDDDPWATPAPPAAPATEDPPF